MISFFDISDCIRKLHFISFSDYFGNIITTPLKKTNVDPSIGLLIFMLNLLFLKTDSYFFFPLSPKFSI